MRSLSIYFRINGKKGNNKYLTKIADRVNSGLWLYIENLYYDKSAGIQNADGMIRNGILETLTVVGYIFMDLDKYMETYQNELREKIEP